MLCSINEIFPECNVHCCFFHFSQCIWKKFKENRLCGKGTYESNKELLFNLQVMCFINCEKIDEYYKQLKKFYKQDKYTLLLGIKFPI